MKVVLQILKEFWISFLAALIWSIVNLYSKGNESWTFVKFINIFGPTFFLVSWMTGQYFRVTRQTKVDENLNAIEQRSKALLDTLEVRTVALLGQISGGDSFCYISVSESITQPHQAVIFHKGIHPLYDLTVRIVDLDVFNAVVDDPNYSINKHMYEKVISIGTLLPSHMFFLEGDFLLGDSESRSFNIFWSARNGFFSQLLRCKKIDGTWFYATKVERNGVLLESINDSYPKNSAGVVEW